MKEIIREVCKDVCVRILSRVFDESKSLVWMFNNRVVVELYRRVICSC